MTRYEIDPMRPEGGIQTVNARPSQKDRPRSWLFNSFGEAKISLEGLAQREVEKAQEALQKAKELQRTIRKIKAKP